MPFGGFVKQDTVGKQRAFNTSTMVQGGRHPDWLTEPAAVAEISLPPLSPTEVVYLPVEVAKECLASRGESKPSLFFFSFNFLCLRFLVPPIWSMGQFFSHKSTCEGDY